MKRILVIDDDDLMREAAEASLTEIGGYDVVSTGDPGEGIRMAGTERPDGILLDVRLPGMDGPEVLHRLREDAATREIPVVFFTGAADEMAAAAGEHDGVRGVIRKPFDFPLLPDQLARILGWHD